jgi:3-dehydroquinate synthase
MDTSDVRAILNFGHTVGHALEKLSGYKGVLHGEAVAIGMVAEAAIGERMGITEKGISAEIKACLELDGLPTSEELLHHPGLIDAMASDKKAEGGELAFSLVTKFGECKLVRNVPREEVEAALSAL